MIIRKLKCKLSKNRYVVWIFLIGVGITSNYSCGGQIEAIYKHSDWMGDSKIKLYKDGTYVLKSSSFDVAGKEIVFGRWLISGDTLEITRDLRKTTNPRTSKEYLDYGVPFKCFIIEADTLFRSDCDGGFSKEEPYLKTR